MSGDLDGEPAEAARLLQAEFDRLVRERGVLERQWRVRHRLALFGLAAVPAYFLAGPFWAGMTVLMIPALIATQSYLLIVRRRELGDLISEAKLDLAAIAADAAPRDDSGRPSLWNSKRPLLGQENV